MKNRPLQVFLVGDGAWKSELRNQDGTLTQWNHREVSSIADADVLFWWACVENIVPVVWFQLGQAIALDRDIQIATDCTDLDREIDKAFGKPGFLSALKLTHNRYLNMQVVDAYELRMADMDLLRPSRFMQCLAEDYCLCEACGGRIAKGERVVRSAFRGVYHKDCHANTFNPNNPSEALFNARLVEALRQENASLEGELEKLRAVRLHK